MGLGAGQEGARARPGLSPARDDDRQLPGPGRALGGESVPGPRTPEPATPPRLAPAREHKEQSWWVRWEQGGQQPRGPERPSQAGGMREKVGCQTPTQAQSYRAGGRGRQGSLGRRVSLGPVRGPRIRWRQGWTWRRLRLLAGNVKAERRGWGRQTQEPFRRSLPLGVPQKPPEPRPLPPHPAPPLALGPAAPPASERA